MTGAVKSRGGCWTRFKLLPFVMIFSGAATLALIAVWSNYAVEAGRATADMLEVLLSTESSVFKIIDAYGVVVGITVGWAAAIVAFALVMSFWKLYLSSSKISASGPPGGAWWQSFGWVASILLTMVAMFMVWLVLMIVLIAVWMVAMAVIEEAAKASQRLLQSLIDVASDLPLNSLFTFPGRGGETVQDLFDKYERQVDDGSLSADDAKDMFVTDVLTDFGPPGAANNTEVREQYERYLEDAITRTVAASSNSTDTPCPTSVCLDLSLYDFLDSDACLCNPEDIQRIRDYADDAFDNLLVGLVLAAACYMAVTVMLIKLSRDQKGVLKDWHWICEMRAMTPASMKLPPPPAGEDPITTSAGRLHDDSAGANARGAHTVPVAAV